MSVMEGFARGETSLEDILQYLKFEDKESLHALLSLKMTLSSNIMK